MGRKILEPIQIKSMELKNRIGFGPMATQPHAPDGSVNQDTIEWYVERARGEVGFALTGTIMAGEYFWKQVTEENPIGVGPPLTLHNESYIPGYKKLSEAVHEHGMKIGAQIGAGGMLKGASPTPYAKRTIWDVVFGLEITVEEFTTEELETIKRQCGETAGRAKAGGFDCVQLHTAHGFISLWGGFMSPFNNRRTDKYGGSWENRLRFPAETIQAMRDKVGDDYPILMRISADELHGQLGVTLEDTLKYTVPIMQEAGVDCFDVTMGTQMNNPHMIPTLYVPRGHYMYLAAAVKKVASVPVIGVGRILDLEMAEKFLEEDMADIIYLGRQLIADPETPKKYFLGRHEDIRKCIGDIPNIGDCCAGCTVNPTAPTMKSTDDVVLAEQVKKVLVIGGGVAGMEAARVAALRGHKVTLMEKDSRLGGKVDLLANALLNYEFRNLVDFLANQMRRLKVDTRVCKEATLDDVESCNPDVVIVATGAEMTISEPARGKPHVMTHVDALRNIHTIGKKVVIQGLGYGSELAISLAEDGKDVILFGKGGEIGGNLPFLRRFHILKRLTDIDVCEGDGDLPTRKEGNPKVLTETSLEDVTRNGVVVTDEMGSERIVPYDTFIISMGRKSNNDLFELLKDKVPEVYQVGDAKKVSEIFEAMKSANEVGNQV